MSGTQQHLEGCCEVIYTKGHTSRPWGPDVVEGSLLQCLDLKQCGSYTVWEGGSASCVSGALPRA